MITGPSSGTFLEDIAEGAPWPVLTIGRSPSNSLLLNDPEVSSKHAEISWNLLVSSLKGLSLLSCLYGNFLLMLHSGS